MEDRTGIWDFITSGKEKVKYICHCIGNGEGRAKIVHFTAKFVKNASFYAFKEAANLLIPGGKEISKIYADTIREIETESREKQDRSCDNEIIGNLSKITNGTGPVILLDGAEKLENIRELKLGSENRVQVDSFAYQTPEDVLRFFMMMEFMGTRYLNNLLVHDNCQQKKV
ncbi:hypothetical protein KY289_012172 [Solanum tuberosum]|nr:hypothetical protein KY289_012172 [Solanum tuberosum]KAH0710319.1 hypothetical protein KY284_011746 [Solanum tuberosum]